MNLAWGVSEPPTPKEISEPNHGRVFSTEFHSVYVVKGVWSLLTNQFLNRSFLCKTQHLGQRSPVSPQAHSSSSSPIPVIHLLDIQAKTKKGRITPCQVTKDSMIHTIVEFCHLLYWLPVPCLCLEPLIWLWDLQAEWELTWLLVVNNHCVCEQHLLF